MSQNLRNLIITILIIITFAFISLFLVLGVGLKAVNSVPEINKIIVTFIGIIIFLILRCIGFSFYNFFIDHPILITASELLLIIITIIGAMQCNIAYSGSGIIIYINILMAVNITMAILTSGFFHYAKYLNHK